MGSNNGKKYHKKDSLMGAKLPYSFATHLGTGESEPYSRKLMAQALIKNIGSVMKSSLKYLGTNQ